MSENRGRKMKDWPIIVGECYHCKEVKELIQRVKHKSNVCEDCRRIRQRVYNKKEHSKNDRWREGGAGRFPYPLQGWAYYNQKFRALANELKNKDREESIAIIRRNLDAVLENKEIMDWVNAHDFAERKEEQKERGEARRRKKENIDTRNLTWEEWEQLGFGGDEDDQFF